MSAPVPTPYEILADASTSDWLKSVLRSALKRDPVEALNDAEMLATVLDEHVRELFPVKHS